MPEMTLGRDTFHYETRGSGEPLIFISGMAGDHSAWDMQLSSHAKHYTCVTFDNRGIGGSADAAKGYSAETYTPELLADDVARLMDALGIGKAHIVGASMGGVIAQAFALSHPQRMVSLSLHSTFARVNGKMRCRFETELFLLKKVEVIDVLTSLAPLIWSERTLSERSHIIENFRASRKTKGMPVSKEVYELQGQAIMKTDFLSRLGQITVPVLITTGTDDGLVPPEESRLIHKAIPGSEYHLFSGCGHAVTFENPRGFNLVSLRFLRKHGGRG